MLQNIVGKKCGKGGSGVDNDDDVQTNSNKIKRVSKDLFFVHFHPSCIPSDLPTITNNGATEKVTVIC